MGLDKKGLMIFVRICGVLSKLQKPLIS